MKKIYLLLMAFILFQLTSCETTEPQPPKEEKPPGYQEDIPWPSLADSPWPMAFGDPQLTKRSKGFGAQLGIIDKITLPYYNKSGIAIGPDSTIYFVAAKYKDNNTSGLTALSFDGKIKWVYNFEVDGGGNPDPGSPIVANDGVIYTTSPVENKVYAINRDGTLKWALSDVITSSYISITPSGTIILLNHQSLIGVSSEGELLWEKPHERILDDYVLSSDGQTIYFSVYTNSKWFLTAVDIKSNTILWQYKESCLAYGTKLVDHNGNIYFLGLSLNFASTAINKLDNDGKLLWQYDFGYNGLVNTDISISLDKNGNSIVGLRDTLFSVSFEGKLNWKLSVGNNFNGLISTDKNNNIYFTISTTYFSPDIIYMSVNEKGKIRWEISDKFFNDYGIIFPIMNAFNHTFIVGYSANKIVKLN